MNKPIDELNPLELHVRLETILEWKPKAPDRVWEEIVRQELAETLHYIRKTLCKKP